jgi:hypothetical protein
MLEVAAALTSMRARLESGVPLMPAASPVTPSARSVSTIAAARKTDRKKLVFLGGVSLAVIALLVAGAWWQTHRQKPAPPQPAIVATTVAPAPETTAPVAPPDANANVPDQAPAPIEAVPAPPPSTPVVPFANKTRAPVPPPVTIAKARPAPLVAAAPTPPPVVAPVPHAPAPPEIVPVKLEDGLPFRIVLLDDVPSDIEVGQALRFRVLDEVKVDGLVVIAKEALVTGSVVALGGKRNFFGERSKTRFRLTSAVSVDGSKINVRVTAAAKDDGVETRTFETPKGSKDKNLIAAAGTDYVAYVAGDQTVHVRK